MYFPFLDEAGEFSRVALDALRQPLESGKITIHRSGFHAAFPARFQLILATNPCPCGNYGVRGAECVCPPSGIRRYAGRISGPLRDRIDIEMQVARVSAGAVMGATTPVLSSAEARERVTVARQKAKDRWAGSPWKVNAEVPGTQLRSTPLRLPPRDRAVLDRALERGSISLRGYDRVLRLAWSLADVIGADRPGPEEIGQALFLKKGLTT